MTRLADIALTTTIALLLAVAPATASSLEVGPIRVQMVGEQRTTTVNIRNSGTGPITVQVRAVDWTQTENGDAYVRSTTLVASPPLAALAPGESQVVRLVIENVA